MKPIPQVRATMEKEEAASSMGEERIPALLRQGVLVYY